MHSFSGKFCEISMAELDIGSESTLIKMNISNFSKHAEMFIYKSCNILDSHAVGTLKSLRLWFGVQKYFCDTKSVTFFIKWPDSFLVIFVASVSSPSKYISQIVLSGQQVVLCRHSMVKLTICTFAATASCKVYTKVCGTFALHFVCLCKSSINLWLQLVKRDSSFLILVSISISQILIIPNIIVIVAFNIRCLFLKFSNLSPSRPLHPFMHKQRLLISKLLQLSFLLSLLLYLLFCLNSFWIKKLRVKTFQCLFLQVLHFFLMSFEFIYYLLCWFNSCFINYYYVFWLFPNRITSHRIIVVRPFVIQIKMLFKNSLICLLVRFSCWLILFKRHI